MTFRIDTALCHVALKFALEEMSIKCSLSFCILQLNPDNSKSRVQVVEQEAPFLPRTQILTTGTGGSDGDSGDCGGGGNSGGGDSGGGGDSCGGGGDSCGGGGDSCGGGGDSGGGGGDNGGGGGGDSGGGGGGDSDGGGGGDSGDSGGGGDGDSGERKDLFMTTYGEGGGKRGVEDVKPSLKSIK